MIRESFIDFLSGILKYESSERWTPEQALQHPFITGEEYIGPFEVEIASYESQRTDIQYWDRTPSRSIPINGRFQMTPTYASDSYSRMSHGSPMNISGFSVSSADYSNSYGSFMSNGPMLGSYGSPHVPFGTSLGQSPSTRLEDFRGRSRPQSESSGFDPIFGYEDENKVSSSSLQASEPISFHRRGRYSSHDDPDPLVIQDDVNLGLLPVYTGKQNYSKSTHHMRHRKPMNAFSADSSSRIYGSTMSLGSSFDGRAHHSPDQDIPSDGSFSKLAFRHQRHFQRDET